jgi:hypothetical protein
MSIPVGSEILNGKAMPRRLTWPLHRLYDSPAEGPFVILGQGPNWGTFAVCISKQGNQFFGGIVGQGKSRDRWMWNYQSTERAGVPGA